MDSDPGEVAMTTDKRTSIWSRLLNDGDRPIPPPVAEYILRLRFSEADDKRLEELADKCQLGTLTPDEQKEYEDFVKAGLVLSVWQSRARLSLRDTNGTVHG
jgi:hypothetical protein